MPHTYKRKTENSRTHCAERVNKQTKTSPIGVRKKQEKKKDFHFHLRVSILKG